MGLIDARGSACIHHVRFIPILEPEETSHILAIPAPPHAIPPPRAVASVCVCSGTAAERPITRLLAAFFGEPSVHTAPSAKLQPCELRADALLLPDATPPSSIHSLKGLMKLAADRIVVISLPAFARLTRGTVSLRHVEQDDDPIHAKVTCANYATRGFALHDTFAYAWPGHTVGSFVQNHFRKTGAMKAFCNKHGFAELLVSMCNQDVTSERPICLHRGTPGGGLFVLDIEPAEAESSTFGEPALAMYLLLCALGQTPAGLGQYVAPVRKEAELRELIREMAVRFDQVVVHDSDVPVEEVTEQLVTIGGVYPSPKRKRGVVLWDRLSSLSSIDRLESRSHRRISQPARSVARTKVRGSEACGAPPMILIRSGLTAGDVESVYGAFVWFKQFVRAEPYRCPYARQLASQFQIAWVPCVAPWEARDGWRRQRLAIADRGLPIGDRGLPIVDCQSPIPNPQSAIVDVASCPINRARVVIPRDDGAYQRYAAWLPRLAAAFGPKAYFAPGVGEGEAFNDRDHIAWRRVRYDVQIVVDAAAFESDAHRRVVAAGGQVVRIEVPGCDADFSAHSIQRTDLAATLLEHVIGLQYGLIAVNRSMGGGTAVHFDAFPLVGPGEALVVDRRDPVLRASASQAG